MKLKVRVGPKGQVVIPKQLRDAIGLKPYASTHAPKLKKLVNLKEITNEEVSQRRAVR
jgi:hypothetical protein